MYFTIGFLSYIYLTFLCYSASEKSFNNSWTILENISVSFD